MHRQGGSCLFRLLGEESFELEVLSGCFLEGFCHTCLNGLDFRNTIFLVTFKCYPDTAKVPGEGPSSKWLMGAMW